MEVHKDQSSPIIDHESNNKINKLMQVIESYSIKEEKIQPNIEQENISSQNNSEQNDCELKSNSKIQTDQNPTQTEELNQKPPQFRIRTDRNKVTLIPFLEGKLLRYIRRLYRR